MNYAVIALTLVAAVEAGLLWFFVRGLGRLDRVESRLAHLTDALALLAETTESGFRASAQELTRVAEAAPAGRAAESRSTTRRISRAVKRGKSVTQIAAEEQIAEGEVQLRMHLAESGGGASSRRSPKSDPVAEPPQARRPQAARSQPTRPRTAGLVAAAHSKRPGETEYATLRP